MFRKRIYLYLVLSLLLLLTLSVTIYLAYFIFSNGIWFNYSETESAEKNEFINYLNRENIEYENIEFNYSENFISDEIMIDVSFYSKVNYADVESNLISYDGDDELTNLLRKTNRYFCDKYTDRNLVLKLNILSKSNTEFSDQRISLNNDSIDLECN